MTKNVQLSRGLDTKVDDIDFPYISSKTWHVTSEGYAARNVVVGGKPTTSYMHREIMGIVPYQDGQIDHINGDRLDNRRENLRACSRTDNTRNQKKLRGSSKYKGVYRNERGTWSAQIRYFGWPVHLGRFKDEYDAACAYDAAATWFFGEFARTNF